MNIKKIFMSSTFYLNFIFCALGCLACFYLQKYYLVPNFLASAVVGLIGSFLPSLPFYDYKKSIACIYTGSFSAMCTQSLFTNSYDLLLLCLLVGFYFNLLSPYFRGFGGKLGAIGFCSSLTFMLIKGGLW